MEEKEKLEFKAVVRLQIDIASHLARKGGVG